MSRLGSARVLLWFDLPSLSPMLQVGSYGGKLKYTISYVPTPGTRGSMVDDANVQIIVSAREHRHPSSLV